MTLDLNVLLNTAQAGSSLALKPPEHDDDREVFVPLMTAFGGYALGKKAE